MPKMNGMRCSQLPNQRSGKIQIQKSNGKVVPSATRKSWWKPIRKISRRPRHAPGSCRPNFQKSTSLSSEQLTNTEKKKKTANPERERFQGKSPGETAFTVNDESLSARDHAVGSADTIGMTLCLFPLFNSKIRP